MTLRNIPGSKSDAAASLLQLIRRLLQAAQLDLNVAIAGTHSMPRAIPSLALATLLLLATSMVFLGADFQPIQDFSR